MTLFLIIATALATSRKGVLSIVTTPVQSLPMSVSARIAPTVAMRKCSGISRLTPSMAGSGFGGMFGMDNAIKIEPGSRCYLVGANIKQADYNTREGTWEVDQSLEELGRLCETVGMEVTGREFQTMQHPSASTFLGSGKASQI